MSLGLGNERAAQPSGVAGDKDPRHRGAAELVDHRDPPAARPVMAHGDAGHQRPARCSREAIVHGDDIASNFALVFGYDASVPINTGEQHAFDLLAPVDAHRHKAVTPRHPGADHCREIAQPFKHDVAAFPKRVQLRAVAARAN